MFYEVTVNRAKEKDKTKKIDNEMYIDRLI